MIAHVGYVIDGQPYVTPTSYWRNGDQRVLARLVGEPHAAPSEAGGAGVRRGIHVDGLVLARSGFHHSVNYRSVMASGPRSSRPEDEKLAALEDFVERLFPGRWAELRPPTRQEIKATTVLRMDLEEVSAKVRTGPPKDDEEDYALPIWAGVLPVATAIGRPQADPRLAAGVEAPGYLAHLQAWLAPQPAAARRPASAA